jgi:hypothetical protein
VPSLSRSNILTGLVGFDAAQAGAENVTAAANIKQAKVRDIILVS